MEFKKGLDRMAPMSFDSLDSLIAEDHIVRLIDSFVDSLDYQELGFLLKNSNMGASAYSPATLLKLYIYGYMNSVRSSRKLEHLSRINLELMWLVNSLVPDHNTISNFRRDNGDAIKMVFQAAVRLGIQFHLIGKETIAGDGVTMRGQNSKKNNFNEKNIARQEKYIASKVAQYLEEMDKIELEEDEEKKRILKKI